MQTDLNHAIANMLADNQSQLFALQRYARVERAVGMLLETNLIDAPIGSVCFLEHNHQCVPCEIVGFAQDRCYLMALAPIQGVQSGAWLKMPDKNEDQNGSFSCGERFPALDQLVGRVINGLGEPLDTQPAFNRYEPLPASESINPMTRPPIDQVLDTGVGVLNSLLTIGVGQRVGLFAGSGVGKSVFMGMLAKHVNADVVVVGLVGERGREVAEFVGDILGDSLARSVVVASPADDSPAMRLRGARLASTLAEQFARQGKQVLLLMDSLTRVAQAQREIGLAMGEPAASKGYTPSSFAWLPKLVERAGRFDGGGSVTGFYTVLMEEDDLQDPVVDTARAILDGHIVLSRVLAEQGIYPAVDVSSSVSRLMNKLASPQAITDAQTYRQLWYTYREQQDLINVGAYRMGSDPIIDRSIALYPKMCDFVRQGLDESVSYPAACQSLQQLFMEADVPALAEAQDMPREIQSGLQQGAQAMAQPPSNDGFPEITT